jgi:VWFA-related protein
VLDVELRRNKSVSIVFCAFVFIVVCFGFASGSAAQQSPAHPVAAQPPLPLTITVTTREVLLDVLVTDASGHPVPGLTAADFSISEEGAPQVIRSLQEHHPMAAEQADRLAATPPLPPNTFTNFAPVRNTNAQTVILLDALNTSVQAQMSLREQLVGYLKHMDAGAQIAIFQLDTEMRLVQGFTSDQKLLLEAARSKRDLPSLQKPIDGNHDQYRRARMEILRAGMRMMGRYLAGYPGRKNLIWFTGQVPMTIFGYGFGDPFRDQLTVSPSGSPDDLSDLTESLTLSRVAVYPVDTRGLQTMPQFTASRPGAPSMRSNMRFENHEAVNIANLERVAYMTGGKAYYNTNDFEHVLGEVIRNGSSYYTLAYATTNQEWRGQLRTIKIAVDRPGVHLQHREGYRAFNPERAEERKINALVQQTAARAAQRGEPNEEEAAAAEPPAANGSAPAAGSAAATASPGQEGTLSPQIKENAFDAAMALGAIPPTEIVFTASLQASDKAEKLEKGSPVPADNYLKPPWQHKPFRSTTILFHAETRKIQLTRTADGLRHGSVDFVAVVYQPTGENVNSIAQTVNFDLDPAQYRHFLAEGLNFKEEIAVPEKGNYFLRLGVHDLTGDLAGALEIAMDQVKPGVAGTGL